MYLRQALKIEHDWWRYLVGLMIILFAWQFIGSVPLIVGLLMNVSSFADIPMDIGGMSEALGGNSFLFLMLISFAIGFVGLIVVIKFIHKQSLRHLTTSREKVDWKRIFFAFLFWGIISSGMVLADYYFNPEGYVFNFNLEPFLILCAIAIILVPIQTSFEEYLFRGYLMQGIGTMVKNKWLPLVLTSVVFGLLHLANPEVDKLGYVIMVYYIGTGFFLGIMTLMDEGLELAIGFHAANNLFTALLVTADWTAFQTHSVFKDMSDPTEMGIAEIFVPVFVVFPILLLIFAKVYKWKNWKEKLFGDIKEYPKEDYKILED